MARDTTEPSSKSSTPDTDVVAGHVSGYFTYAAQFWRGADRRRAWTLTIAILAVLAVTLAVNVWLNVWTRAFFDALERRDAPSLWAVLSWLPLIVISGAALAVAMIRLRMALQIRWREDVSRRLLADWIADQRYYRLALAQRSVDTVEHRIAEDARLATEPLVDLGVGLLWSLSSAAAFVGVLLVVGGSIMVGTWTIPGYLALAALGYAAIVCTTTIYVGRPLAGRVALKNEGEAQLRYELTRLRENAESIASLQGDVHEHRMIGARYDDVVSSWFAIARSQGHLTWVLNANLVLATIVPVLLAAPKYLTGELSLGAVMQLTAAFVSVLGALNWFADNFIRLAEVAASARRVDELRAALASFDAETEPSLPAIAVGTSTEQTIELLNVTLETSDGDRLVKRANLRIEAGQKVLIEGKSGSGKSTLLRALAGLWPWGAGVIRLPVGATLAFVPQRSYIPLGKLRDALFYPDASDASPHVDAAVIFHRIGLPHLVDKLDDVEPWDRILSGGERQRLAFGRLLVKRPDIVVLDEATSALDDEGQHQLFALLNEALPNATVLNVAHRKGLEMYHDQKLSIVSSRDGSTVASSPIRHEKYVRATQLPRRRASPHPPTADVA